MWKGGLSKSSQFVIYVSLHPLASFRHGRQAKLYVISSSENSTAEGVSIRYQRLSRQPHTSKMVLGVASIRPTRLCLYGTSEIFGVGQPVVLTQHLRYEHLLHFQTARLLCEDSGY